MTSGERMVWAVALVAALDRGAAFAAAATQATGAVKKLRRATRAGDLDDDAKAMLDDMLGVQR